MGRGYGELAKNKTRLKQCSAALIRGLQNTPAAPARRLPAARGHHRHGHQEPVHPTPPGGIQTGTLIHTAVGAPEVGHHGV